MRGEKTIVSLMTQKNQSGDTVLQDETVGEDNLKMMLALAFSVLEDLVNLSARGGEEEERRTIEIAAKVLPELIDWRRKRKCRNKSPTSFQ